MPNHHKQLKLWKATLAFVPLCPAIYGVAHSVLSFGASLSYGEKTSVFDLLGTLFMPLITTFLFWASLFNGELGRNQIVVPTLLSAIFFCFIANQLLQRLDATSDWKIRLVGALVGMCVCVCVVVVLDPSYVSKGWDVLYFYDPGKPTLPDYSEWGFLQVYGELFHLITIGVTGLLIGLLNCSSKVTLHLVKRPELASV